jgi:lipopolysaccharide/colanic/teichoic acid biosynthesis glycosyltransferase
MKKPQERTVRYQFSTPIKRLCDVLLAGVMMIAAGPVMLLTALAIRLIDGRPVFFRQLRVGIDGLPFELLKFRTMLSAASDTCHRDYASKWIAEGRPFTNGERAPLFKIAADPRVTRLGGFLRRFSIDELPQLINVLRGEMSIVGPRPAIPYEVAMYQDWHKRRLNALPGLTGLWQVSGHNRLSFDEMVNLDIEYIEHWSLARDLQILARTPAAVLRGSR